MERRQFPPLVIRGKEGFSGGVAFGGRWSGEKGLSRQRV